MAGRASMQDVVLFLLRAGAGLMLFWFHGWAKLKGAWGYLVGGQEWPFIGFLDSRGLPLPVVLALGAALAEGVASLLLAAGLWTRWVALLIIFNMAVAVWHHLTSDMRFELAAMHLLVALLFAATPPGRISLDAQFRRRA